ncbi:MAG TPA: alpha/beta hydrolase [Candidatus Baltobacteraceae bacterium]|nr:alpha/beta hydrolase [Candidatus Baltobacteraceae bacterium]
MRGLRCVCSILLTTAGAVLFVLDTGGCAKHRLPGGLSKLKPCRLPGISEELFCGKLTVFENRETRTGRTIDLNIVVLPAFDQKTKAGPVFDLAGGPGASSADRADFYAGPGKVYRRRHDVVCVDQRGTGKSNRLAIPREKTPSYYLSEMFPIDHVKEMRHTLEQRADLTKYTTSIAMDDLDEVRSWLDYDRISLFGASYGTRAALVYMRQHPEHVRSAILLGVAPTDLKMPLHHAESGARAMDLLLGECEQDARCHAAFPQIRDDWKNVLAQLEKQPARVEYSPRQNAAPTTVEIQRGVFGEKIRTWMYDRDKAARIPLIVHRAANGDLAPFLQQAIGPSIPDFVADGMYLSVTCAEDVPFINPEEAAKLTAGNPFGNYRVFQQTRACGMWPRGEIPTDFLDPVSSNAPVLIFSGNMDPVTPPRYGEEVARHLPNSRHVIIPQAGHSVDGLSDAGCIDRIAIEFLEKGDAKNLDVSCVERMAPPPFVTK